MEVAGRSLGWLVLVLIALGAEARAQVVINEIGDRNRATIRDEDGDASDWVELYNAGDSPVELEGLGLTDDRLASAPWRFPSVALAPGTPLLVWCSGKDRRQPSVESITARLSPIPFLATLVNADAEWSYLIGPPEEVAPPQGWNQPGFDDREWPRGQPGFGFGDDDDRTVLPEDIGAVFLRHEFVIEGRDPRDRLVLQARYDDAFVLWINGVRVLSENFPEDEPVTFASVAIASREARSPLRWVLDEHADLLVEGTNTLAIALLNRSSSSGDLSLVPELGTVPPVYHTDFRLREGEVLLLLGPDREVLDGALLGPQSPDRSFGRFPDGASGADGAPDFAYHARPTPGAPNDELRSPEPIPELVVAEPPGGRRPGPLDIVLDAQVPFPGFEIRYTLDGSEPSASSPLYELPLRVDSNTVVRASGFLDGEPFLAPVSHTYLVEPDALALPILAISMSRADFVTVHTNDSGRGRPWERSGFLEVLDESGERMVGAGVGLRLHGGAGRGGDLRTKKSYKAYFRAVYGAPRLVYPLIADTPVARFDKLVLRANFNDAFRTGGGATFVRDQVIRDLHEDMGALVSHGDWYNLLVNTEHRGIYNVVERMDKVFFASYFPEVGEEWDVIKTGSDVLDGTGVEWSRMLAFFRTAQLADDAVLDEAAELIDVENFTSYMILNIWAQNHDWPHNNWYAARPRVEGGRWIFLSWDAEFGIGLSPGGFSSDTLTHVFGRSDAPASIVLTGLFRNRRYGAYFVEELERYLQGALSPDNVLARIARHRDRIAPDVAEEIRLTGGSVGAWQNNVRVLENFARRRPDVVRTLVLRNSRLQFPRVLTVSPRRVRWEASTRVTLAGLRFGEETRVEIAGVPVESLELVSSREISVELPADLRIGGSPTVRVFDGPELGHTASGLLEVEFPLPEVSLLEPDFGAGAGGDTVLIHGAGFLPGARVEFGDLVASDVELLGDAGELLRCVTPPGIGVVPVRVVNTRPGPLASTSTAFFTYVPGASFRRGDCDQDGSHTINDAVCLLGGLFAGRTEGEACRVASDVDDSGSVDITDAVELLLALFQRGAPPREPYRDCGTDPTADGLGCDSYDACAVGG